MKNLLSLVLATMSLVLSLPASAQFAKPEDAIKYRKSALTIMGTHWARLAGMAQGRIPYDAKVAAESAKDDSAKKAGAAKIEEMQKVYDAVLGTDILILATPIRWNNHSALVQKFLERMNSIENQYSWFAGRPGMFFPTSVKVAPPSRLTCRRPSSVPAHTMPGITGDSLTEMIVL